jgi:hypothetical protein
LIVPSKLIIKLAILWAPSLSLNSHNYGLQILTIMEFKVYIFKLP